jgi:hypothetical protein
MTVSRLITDLHPEMQVMVRAALVACASDGLDVLVTCTFRSAQAQAELYAIGRTKPGRIVTNARAGKSTHNFRLANSFPAALAVDVVPMRHGKPVWGLAGNGIDEDPSDDDRDDLELWQRVRAHFEAAGMKSASRWQRFKEWPHFQHPRANQIMEGAQA